MWAEIFDFLNHNDSAFMVFFTFVVAASTAIYAVLTCRLVSETRKMREIQTEPKIHISLETYDFSINILYLSVENIGLGPARNVRFEPSVISGEGAAEKLLSELTASNFFTVGLRHFGPDQKMKSSFTEMHKDYEGKIASVLSFKVSYESVTGKKYNDDIIIDMSEHGGGYQIGTPNLYSIAKSLESMQKDIASMASGFKRLKVDVFSSADRQEEINEIEMMQDTRRTQ